MYYGVRKVIFTYIKRDVEFTIQNMITNSHNTWNDNNITHTTLSFVITYTPITTVHKQPDKINKLHWNNIIYMHYTCKKVHLHVSTKPKTHYAKHYIHENTKITELTKSKATTIVNISEEVQLKQSFTDL